MLILRRIIEGGTELNQVMGDGYILVSRDNNYARFRELFREYFKTEHVTDDEPNSTKDSKNCYAFVREGSFTQALYKNQKAFMMTESGQTFANLTYK
jgi:hypothetical protein